MLLVFDVLLDHGRGCSAACAGEVGARPEVSTPYVFADVGAVFLAQSPAGDAFEVVDLLRYCDFWWVVHQQMDVVGFTVELA